MNITFVETELGETIVKALRKDGWKKTHEYSWLAFDKGIDYDSYTLKKGAWVLEFEWTNWFEWEIQGTKEAIETLAKDYGLSVTDD